MLQCFRFRLLTYIRIPSDNEAKLAQVFGQAVFKLSLLGQVQSKVGGY